MKRVLLLFVVAMFAATSVSAQSGTRTRSAKTGRYVTKDYGNKHPSTTVKEKTYKSSTGSTRRKKY